DVPQREQALVTRQRALETAEGALRARQQDLSRLRQQVEGRAARLHLSEMAWQGERARLLTELRGRTELSEKHLAAVVDLRQRWARRRKQELEQLRAERAVCEQLRQEYATLRQEYWKRGLAVEERQRELAEKTLAVEEYRQHFILRAPDPAAVEGRLERIRKRWAQQNAAAMRETAEQFRRLHDEAAAVQQRGRELLKVAEELARRETTVAQ